MTTPPSPKTWIAGIPEDSAVEETVWLHDPNTEEALQRARSSASEQVDRAIDRADQAHREGSWRDLGVAGRAPYLLALADALDHRSEDIAWCDALNSGVPIHFTRLFAQSLGQTVRDAVALAVEQGDVQDLPMPQGPVRLRRVPWGPTTLIAPWNAPAALAVKKTAFALAAGAPVVLKPSPVSPWSAELLAQAVSGAQIPEGVFGLVHGGRAVGEQLTADSRIKAIAMTGSTETGRQIARSAAPRFARLRLELGSNNPVVVRADANVAATARSLFDGMVKLNGQWCEAPRNVYVHVSVADELVDSLSALVAGAEVGSSLDEATRIGPMAFREHRDGLVAQRGRWAEAGHRVVHAAEHRQGWFFAPTLVVGQDIEVDAEVFGPMLTIEAATSDAGALDRARRTAGGLAAYVFGDDEDAAIQLGEQLLGGEVKVNGTSLLDMSPESAQSFFGSSGLGGHGDRDVLDFYAGKQIVGVDLVDPPI